MHQRINVEFEQQILAISFQHITFIYGRTLMNTKENNCEDWELKYLKAQAKHKTQNLKHTQDIWSIPFYHAKLITILTHHQFNQLRQKTSSKEHLQMPPINVKPSKNKTLVQNPQMSKTDSKPKQYPIQRIIIPHKWTSLQYSTRPNIFSMGKSQRKS